MDDTPSTDKVASVAEARARGSAFSPPAEPAGGEPPRNEPAFAGRTGRAGSHAPRLPLAELKRGWRIEEAIQAAGTTLTRAGEDRLVGHCPFHEDRTPSFTVYLSTQRFQCYGRCHQHGDVLDFVQLVCGCSLTQAIRWLEETHPTNRPVRVPGPPTPAPASTPLPLSGDKSLAVGSQASARTSGALARETPSSKLTLVSTAPAESWSASASAAWNEEADRQLTLTLATALYAQALARHGHVLDYLRQRGIPLRVARQQRLGYSDGRILAVYCAVDPSLLVAAQRSGLLNRAGVERFAGRLVVPEIRAGRTVWMIARSVPPTEHLAERTPLTHQALPVLDDGGVASTGEDGRARRRMPPRYLGLSTPRHYLLGLGRASATLAPTQRANGISPYSRDARLTAGILVVEGALDYVIAQSWHLPVPCVALLGTHPSSGQLAELVGLHRQTRGAPVLLALDSDAAGRSATQELARALASLGVPALIVPDMPGAKDLGDLSLRPDGRACLLRALGHVLSAPNAPVPWGGPESSPVALVSAPHAPDRLGQPPGPDASPDGNTRAETWDGAEGAGTP